MTTNANDAFETIASGSLTKRQITLVQHSWAKVLPIADQAAELFYAKLFQLDPQLQLLFTTDQKEQGRKLMQMISVAVNGLDDLERIVPAVQDLGRRHVDYQVQPGHYETVGGALLWTLGQGLRDDFTTEVQQAWALAYTTLADVMKDAAYS